MRLLIDADSYDEFETYLNNLEEEQALYLANTISTSEWNPDHPPIWSYQQRIERVQHRHKRMLQKLKM